MESKLESLKNLLTQDEQLSGQLSNTGGCGEWTFIIDDTGEEIEIIDKIDT